MSKGAWTAIGSLIIVIIVFTIFLLSGNAERARENLATSLGQKITDLGVAKDKAIADLKHQQEINRLNAQHQQELAELAAKGQKELIDLEIEHLKELIEAQRIPRSPKPPPYRTDRFRGEVYRGENFKEHIGYLAEVAAIDYYWGSRGPLGLRDHFSVRWQGLVWFQAGNYRFRVCADDGARLYIDNRLVINRWVLHSKTTSETELYLSQDYHTIKLEYHDSTGQAVCRLSWQRIDGDP